MSSSPNRARGKPGRSRPRRRLAAGFFFGLRLRRLALMDATVRRLNDISAWLRTLRRGLLWGARIAALAEGVLLTESVFGHDGMRIRARQTVLIGQPVGEFLSVKERRPGLDPSEPLAEVSPSDGGNAGDEG